MSLAQLVTGRFREREAGEPYIVGGDLKPKYWLGRFLAFVSAKR